MPDSVETPWALRVMYRVKKPVWLYFKVSVLWFCLILFYGLAGSMFPLVIIIIINVSIIKAIYIFPINKGAITKPTPVLIS